MLIYGKDKIFTDEACLLHLITYETTRFEARAEALG